VLTLVVGPEFTLADIVFEAASAQGTVGLSSNLTAPDMPVVAEVVFILQMWLGRLEIFPVLVLLRALFFGARRR
jgi:trk system potassium uptake protein TrkH